MKRELRRRHLAVFLVLAIVLPVLIVLGLRARRPMPVMDVLPAFAGEGAQGGVTR